MSISSDFLLSLQACVFCKSYFCGHLQDDFLTGDIVTTVCYPILLVRLPSFLCQMNVKDLKVSC